MKWPSLLICAMGLCCDATARAQDAVTVAVSPTGEGCPTSRAVADALGARLAGRVRATVGEAQTGYALRLLPEEAGGLRLRLVRASDGVALLERLLDRAGTDVSAAGDCSALADTVALVVERYLREIKFRAPSSGVVVGARLPAEETGAPVPHTVWQPGLALGLRVGLDTGPAAERERFELLAALAVVRGKWLVGAVAGMTGDDNRAVEGGTFRLQRYPARLRVGYQIAGGPRLAVGPLLGGTLDVLVFETRDIAGGQRGMRLEPGLDGGAFLQWFVGRRFAVRTEVAAGVGGRPRDFRSPAGEVIARTPRVMASLLICLGFRFE